MSNNNFYTNEKSQLILMALLKQYGIKRVVASPGTGNMALVVSMQHDSYFEMYSCVDERSAAYMACGIAAESGEPVLITCTEATASRNYLPGLTEAFYRKLPILAIFTGRGENRIGKYEPQSIDNRVLPNDVAKFHVNIPACHNSNEEPYIVTLLNEAINNLFTNGGGPVCVIMESYSSYNFTIKDLPQVRVIRTYDREQQLPPLPKGKTAILVGAHHLWSKEQTEAVEIFCKHNNAVVLCDLTSNYNGKYKINFAIAASQEGYKKIIPDIRLVICIGTVCGDYYTANALREVKEWWMINEDGIYHDRFFNLTAVITTKETEFFAHYSKGEEIGTSFCEELKGLCDNLTEKIPDLPFSNLWVAHVASKKIPDGCVVHAAINNSFRSWNFFSLPTTVTGSCNVGGFGIDGGLSTMVGASLVHPDKIYFGVMGDLAFFYDMNALGNRHIGCNIRLLIVNNGRGQEFRNYQHPASRLGEDADKYVAAGGHYGKQSPTLVKNYAENLGFKYFSASTKEEFLSVYKSFFNSFSSTEPMLMEIFTNTEQENKALQLVRTIVKTNEYDNITAKKVIKNIIGVKGVSVVKAIKKSLAEE